MKEILPFLSTLIWQVIIVVVLFQLRTEIKSLLKRIAKLKFKDAEFEFQESSAIALDAPPIAKQLLKLRDEKGFFTREGVFDLVNNSKYIDSGETVRDALLVFNTPSQHTWLVRSGKRLFYILDDEKTRTYQSLIQKMIDLPDITLVRTQKESDSSGIFNIEGTGWWYYSVAELGSPQNAKQKIDDFIKLSTDGK